MTGSRPDLVFPPCPGCEAAVSWTDLDEAAWYLVGSPLGQPNRKALRISVAAPLLDAGVAMPSMSGGGPAGAPEHDLLTLHPCGHHLVGAACHAYNVAALNLTWPNIRIEVKVTLPPGVLNDSPVPAHQVATSLIDRAEVEPMAAEIAGALIAGAIQRTAWQLAGSLTRQAEPAPLP